MSPKHIQITHAATHMACTFKTSSLSNLVQE